MLDQINVVYQCYLALVLNVVYVLENCVRCLNILYEPCCHMS